MEELLKKISDLNDLVKNLQLRISQLEAENADLRRQLNQNSRNSSKPPSTDGFKKQQAAFKRGKNKKQGGQVGHKGRTLNQVSTPDKIEQHHPNKCKCGCDLSGISGKLLSKRQVFDLPQPRLEITEHQNYTKKCPKCGSVNHGKFPETVKSSTQYGSGVKAFTVLLNTSYKLPIIKIKQLFQDLFGYPINESTIHTNNRLAYQELEISEKLIKQEILKSQVAHSDETGLRVEGKLHWLHSISTTRYTHLFVHAKRGLKAMNSEESLIPHYKGCLVHDCWSSYFNFKHISHAICNAHLLRELQGLKENGSKWANRFKKLLLHIYNNTTAVNISKRGSLEKYYDNICKIALSLEPEPIKTKKKGKPKKTKGRNLLDRLMKYKTEVLSFAFNENIPFTNNLAERDVRPAKLKQKVSGSFRTFEGARIYARIESIVSSFRKNRLNIFDELKNTFCEACNSFTESQI